MSTEPKKNSVPRFVVPLLVLTVAVLLLVIAWLMQGSSVGKAPAAGGAVAPESEVVLEETTEADPQESADAGAQEAQDLTLLETRDPDDPLAVGAVDAPIGMVVFSDYQCPYCGRWNNDTLPTMLEYVDQGLLRIEWRDAVIFGASSEAAARAAYAAALQGHFLEYNDALFPGGDKLPESSLTDEALIELAGDLGLDTTRFAADLTSPETAAVVAEHAALATGVGVTSTPTFALGGVPIVGAQPTEVFTSTFEDVLAAKQG